MNLRRDSLANILSNDDLRKQLEADYSSKTVNKESLVKRKWNIMAFNGLERSKLKYNKKEKRILLYQTLEKENIYIQFPGKESEEKPKMPLDFRPKVRLRNKDFAIDLSFGAIWDILDDISKNHNAYLKYVASVFFRLGYMHEYKKVRHDYVCEDIEIKKSSIEACSAKDVALDWYCINLNDDVWHTLNDKIGWINLGNGQQVSFEGFIKMVDLLFQNEDCKYYYKNVVLSKKSYYKYSNGRNNSSAANLLILNYLEGNVKLSKLLDSFQKSRGVPTIRKSDYSIVTDSIIVNLDMQTR